MNLTTQELKYNCGSTILLHLLICKSLYFTKTTIIINTKIEFISHFMNVYRCHAGVLECLTKKTYRSFISDILPLVFILFLKILNEFLF